MMMDRTVAAIRRVVRGQTAPARLVVSPAISWLAGLWIDSREPARRVLMLTALLVLATLASPPAEAETFDMMTALLCSSPNQDGCWIRRGTPVCDRQQVACWITHENTPARVLGREGNYVRVETADGVGYVSAPSIVLDGSK